jgi:hypothetical protein
MKIYLLRSFVLTDEHPMAARGTPVLVDLKSWKIYNPRDLVVGLSAQQVLSQTVAEMGKNNFLPEEIHFISRFKEGSHEIQSLRGDRMSIMNLLTHQEKEFLKRS